MSRLKQNVKKYLTYSKLLPPALGLLFFTLAFYLVYPIFVSRGNWLKFILVAGALILIALAVGLIVSFVRRQNLLSVKDVRSVTIATAVNTILGLSFPIFVFALVSNSLMQILSRFPNLSTVWCDLRRGLVMFYFHNHIYLHLINLFLITIFISVLLLTLGSSWEKIQSVRK